MKSFNGLWDQMMTTENIIESIENAHKGKGKKLKKKRYKLLVYLYEHSYLKVTKTYSMYLKFIKPKISFKYLRKRVSAYDRRINGMENRSRDPGQKARAA